MECYRRVQTFVAISLVFEKLTPTSNSIPNPHCAVWGLKKHEQMLQTHKYILLKTETLSV
jgi:hypothetical protein